MSDDDASGDDPEIEISAAPTESASRRSFLDTAIVGGGAVVGLSALYPAVRFLEPVGAEASDATMVGRVADLAPGTSRAARLGETPVLIIRDLDGTFRAYEAICPHLQCVVRFAKETDDISCACHGGRFSLNGSPKSGPPKQPLVVLRVNVIGEEVLVSRT
jgi:cytochrome b6-f complex iron-sulfur subunit